MGPVSLRTHSWYSLLEGVDSPERLAEVAAEQGYGSVALTDVNSVAGAVEFAAACQRVGVRGVVGARLVYGQRRCTVLICDPPGWRSVCRVISRCNVDGKADLLEMLAIFHDGLHVLVDDPSSLRPSVVDVFKDRLWLEMVRPGRSGQAENVLLDAGIKVGERPVASLGVRMAAPSGYQTFRLVSALRSGKTLGELPASLGVTRDNHLAGDADVRDRFRDQPAWLANAVTLSQRCRCDVLPRGSSALPVRLPHGVDALSHLAAVCDRSMTRLNLAAKPAVRRRLQEELNVIGTLGLAGYFLLAWDLAEEAKRQRWPFLLRGSAGASLVLHLLGLTDVEPTAHGLRFERFLSASREGAPDVDVEFSSHQRGRVLGWLIQRHGNDHVARVGSYSHLRCVSALKAAMKLNGLSDDQVKAVRAPLGKLETLDDDRLTVVPAEWPVEAEGWPRTLAAAKALQDRPVGLDVHPSKVILSADEVGSLAPIQPWPKDARVTYVQLDDDACAAVGLGTLDLLGSNALAALADGEKTAATLSAPEEADADLVASLVASGDAVGVSQVEATLSRRVLMRVKPADVREVADALALARPGCAASRDTYLKRRHGAEAVAYPHPSAERALSATLGTLLYEDDAISLLEAVAGLNGAEADRLPRRFASGDVEATAELIAACAKVNVPEPSARAVAATLQAQEAYSFCKSHALAVSSVAWRQLALRVRCPVAFWLACFNHHEGRFPLWAYVERAKADGLVVLAPCANRSQANWIQETTALRAGLDCINGLSPGAVVALLEDRERSGPFASLDDAKRRLSLAPRDLQSLSVAGAFDFAGKGRQSCAGSSWPVAGVVSGHADRRAEWEAMRFSAGPPMMSLARPALPLDLSDSRVLRASEHGRKLKLAGLVADVDGSSLVVLDEFGLADVETTPGVEQPGESELVIAEGAVDVRHGAAVLKANKVAGWHPGVVTVPRVAGAA